MRASDILDPSSINLAPVPDLYQAFMKTLLKPAPEAPNTVALGGRQQRQQTAAARKGTDTGGASDGSTAGKANRHGWWGAGVVAGKGSSRAVMDHGLLAALSAKMKADRGGDT